MIKICICGAGTMGSGIAQVSAQAGHATILFDLSQEVINNAKNTIEKSLQNLVGKNRIIAEQKEEIFKRIHFTTLVEECQADLIIEAIVEKLEVKVNLFQQLAALNEDDTILASNTSSLSIEALAKEIPGSERVAGVHFFNPAPVMKLVEIVKTSGTDQRVIDRLVSTIKGMGKVPVVCKDSPGFIVNRVARPYYIESLRIAEEGEVDFEIIDRLLENAGFRMGPFRLMDLIGNDVNYAVSCSVYEQMGNPERLKPSFIQKAKVESGELGRKTGKGYYAY